MNPIVVPIIQWTVKRLMEAIVAQAIEELRSRNLQKMSYRDKVILRKRLDHCASTRRWHPRDADFLLIARGPFGAAGGRAGFSFFCLAA